MKLVRLFTEIQTAMPADRIDEPVSFDTVALTVGRHQINERLWFSERNRWTIRASSSPGGVP
jgi:hypothetical protein